MYFKAFWLACFVHWITEFPLHFWLAMGRDFCCLPKGKKRDGQTPSPVSHRLRFSYGKEPEDAYLRDLRGLRVFQKEGTITSFLGSHSLLREKVEPIRSCFSTLFLPEALFLHTVKYLDSHPLCSLLLIKRWSFDLECLIANKDIDFWGPKHFLHMNVVLLHEMSVTSTVWKCIGNCDIPSCEAVGKTVPSTQEKKIVK